MGFVHCTEVVGESEVSLYYMYVAVLTAVCWVVLFWRCEGEGICMGIRLW